MKYSQASNIANFLGFSVFDKFKLFFNQKVTDKILFVDSNKLTLKSLNGRLEVDFIHKKVTKIINSKLEPHFLENELYASKKIKSNTPKLINYSKKKNQFYVTHELIESWISASWKDWPDTLQKLTPIIANVYLGEKANEYSLLDYKNQIEVDFKKALRNSKYLLGPYKIAVKLLTKCIDKYFVAGRGYLVFQHGDLVPNNIFIKNNNYFVIDWANGGNQSLGYDLMIQSFYFPYNYVWKNFDKISFLENNDKKVFFGWTKRYLNLFENKYHLGFTNSQIKLLLVLTLGELTIKNFLRYQTNEEYRDGTGMLENVIQICKNILNS